MPPRRAAAAKAKAAIEDPEPAPPKAASKAATVKKAPAAKKATTTKKASAKATSQAPAKPAAKSTTTKKPAATKSTKKRATSNAPATKPKANTAVKRKATDEPEDDRVNGTKRSRSESVKPAAAPKKERKIAQPKPKKPRVKGPVVNDVPNEPLNVYVFGEGSSGELGLGSAKGQIEVKRPRLNPLLDAEKVAVVAAAVGGMHTAVLTKSNNILTWGVNDQGALGRDTAWEGGLRDIDEDDKSDSDSDSDSDTGVNPHESTPTNVDMTGLPDDLTFVQVACTDSATFALTDEGQVYGWGTFRVSHPSYSNDLR